VGSEQTAVERLPIIIFIIFHLPFTARARFEIDEGQLKNNGKSRLPTADCRLTKWHMKNDKCDMENLAEELQLTKI